MSVETIVELNAESVIADLWYLLSWFYSFERELAKYANWGNINISNPPTTHQLLVNTHTSILDVWTAEYNEVLVELQKEVLEGPILAHPNFKK